jgi:hypothetical protein
MLFVLNVHASRIADMLGPDNLTATPSIPVSGYHDGFGNWCTRLLASVGLMRVTADTIVNDSGEPDPVVPSAQQTAVDDLPDEAMMFLLPSRYCESDCSHKRPGTSSTKRRQAGPVSKQSVTSFITTSPSATNMLALPKQQAKLSQKRPAFVATIPIWPLPSVAV